MNQNHSVCKRLFAKVFFVSVLVAGTEGAAQNQDRGGAAADPQRVAPLQASGAQDAEAGVAPKAPSDDPGQNAKVGPQAGMRAGPAGRKEPIETQEPACHPLLSEGEGSFYQTGEFPGEGGVRLRYARFGREKGEKGSLVFINGRAENLFKYIELFHELSERGYSPVYTYDHRGQGFSDRLLPDRRKGHVEDYSHYRKDLRAFVDLVLKDSLANKERLFAAGHSMGGAVLADYLQSLSPDEEPVFKAAALSSPMFRIRTSFWTETLVFPLSAYCSVFPCSASFFGKKARDKSLLTDSRERTEFLDCLQKESFPEIALGAPSLHWIIESFEVSKKIMAEERIKSLRVPILILQSERERLVSNAHQDRFCRSMPEGRCRIVKLNGLHEHFFEKDETRSAAIEAVLQFFSSRSH